MIKVKVKHNNQTYYVTPVDDNPHRANGDSTDYFMYRIENGDGSIIGCITFTWARTARVVASELGFSNDREEELAYLSMIPHLPFYPDLAKKLYTTCFRYMFNTMTDGLEADNSGYNIKVQDGFTNTKQRLMFGGEPSDDQVRREILTLLNNHHIDQPGHYLHSHKLELFIPVDQKTLMRNLLFLHDEGFVDCKTVDSKEGVIVSHAKILNPGIKHIEDSSEFSVKFPTKFVYQKFMGDNINASTSGDNSPIVIKSQNVNIAFNEIETEIKTTDVTNKQEMVVLLGLLKDEVTKRNDPVKVKGLLAEIKKKGSWLNDKILSHPLLAQIIAQALAKAAGLT